MELSNPATKQTVLNLRGTETTAHFIPSPQRHKLLMDVLQGTADTPKDVNGIKGW
jgi:hypothetical protein